MISRTMIQSIPPAGKTRAIRPMSRIKQFIVAGDEVRIPGWVIDYASFHKWTLSNAFPQSGRVDYIDDELWADLTMEEFVTHNQIKAEISFVLTGIVRASDAGAIIAGVIWIAGRFGL